MCVCTCVCVSTLLLAPLKGFSKGCLNDNLKLSRYGRILGEGNILVWKDITILVII